MVQGIQPVPKMLLRSLFMQRAVIRLTVMTTKGLRVLLVELG